MRYARRTWIMVASTVILASMMMGLGLASTSTSATASTDPAAGELLVQKALAYVKEIKDARLTVAVATFDPASGGEIARMRGQLEATVKPPVVRLLFLEPIALADQLVIVDGDEQQLYVYSPVTEQVMVQPLSQAAGMMGMGFPYAMGAGGNIEINKLLQIPAAGDETKHTATLVRYEKWKGTDVGVVDVVSGDFPGRQRLWILRSTGQVAQIETYDQQNRLMARMVIESLQRNIGLQAVQLLQLPRGARMVP